LKEGVIWHFMNKTELKSIENTTEIKITVHVSKVLYIHQSKVREDFI